MQKFIKPIGRFLSESISPSDASKWVASFDFKTLFNEIGWDWMKIKPIPIKAGTDSYMLTSIAQKRGLAVLQCVGDNGSIPDASVRKQIDSIVEKLIFEHIIIYTNESQTKQVWQFRDRGLGTGKPLYELEWAVGDPIEPLHSLLSDLEFTMEEEESGMSLVYALSKVKNAFKKLKK